MSILDSEYTGPTIIDDDEYTGPTIVDDGYAGPTIVVDEDNTLGEDVYGAAITTLDGLTFGFGDELTAGLRVGADEVLQIMFPEVNANETARQKYERYLNEGREIEQRFSDDNPILAASLEIGGALVTGVGGVGRLVGTAATRAGNIARQAATAAADVAVYQIGEAEGTIQERIGQVDPATVALGAAIGGIAGSFLKGTAEVPSEKVIKDRSTAKSKKTFSASQQAVTRGRARVGEGEKVRVGSRVAEDVAAKQESVLLRTKDWTARNVNDREAMHLVDSDGQTMRVIGETINVLDQSGGKRGSLAKLHNWFEKTTEGQRAMSFLMDTTRASKFGAATSPAQRQKDFTAAQNIINASPSEIRKTFDSMNAELRILKDLDPGWKATGDFWPMLLKDGVSEAAKKTGKDVPTLTGNYKTPVESFLGYMQDVRTAQVLAKNFGVPVTQTKGLRSANDIRKKALELEKKGLSTKQITKKVEQMLRQNEKSKTDRVIDAIIKSKEKTLSAEQQANLREILVTTFVSGTKASSPILDGLRVVVNTSQLARLSGTILNVSEIGVAATNFGLVNAIKALPQSIRSALLTNGDQIVDDFGNALRLPDLGIVNQYMGEVKQGKGKIDDFANFLFTISGVKMINRLGQETALNAALNQAKSLAKKGKLTELKAAKGMTPTEIKMIETQLKNNNIRHPDVKDFVFRQLTDVAPVSRTSMPKAYNDHPDGRVFYSMMSFMVQQHNLLRENVGQNVIEAYKKGLNSKEGRKHFKDAVDYGARYAVFTAGLAGLFDDGRKILRGDDVEEYDPVASTANQLAQFATMGVVQPRAETWGGSPVSLLNPPQFSMVEDVTSLGVTAVQDLAEGEEFNSEKLFKVMQRWFPPVSNVDDFLRYFNDGERLLTED
jgi:hypothetical protein